MSVRLLKNHLALVLFSFTVLLSSGLWAQVKTQNTFVSSADKNLTVRTVLVAPVEDNLSGIYANPIEQHLKDNLLKDSQWTLSSFSKFSGYKLQTLYTNKAEAIRLAKAAQADAILKTRLTKGPSGISAKMTLFSGKDGLPLVEENMEGLKKFEINDVKNSFADMFSSLRNRMPYRAEVLSRRGQEITFNAGKNLGIKTGSDISVIQILRAHRHPKLNFIVSTEKEILGKARVFKVDDTLTFAHLIMEREPGVVQVGNKILPDEYIRYSEPYITEDGQVLTDLNLRKDQDLSYGEKPNEWLPDHPAQYGRFGVMGGLTQYQQATSFSNISSIEGINNLAPTLDVSGEFWISHLWWAGLNLRSAAFSVDNDLAGSKPEKINMTLNSYHVQFGRNFLLSPDFFGPKIIVGGGFSKYSARADETNPLTFTNMEYGGLVFSFAGQFPVGDTIPTDVGAKFLYYWNPTVNETRSSGGSKDVKINDFGFYFNYHAKPKLSYIGELRFQYYTSGFNGPGDRVGQEVTSISHKVTSLLFGIEFLF